MHKLSTGEESTLGVWKKLVLAAFGSGPALDYIENKIKVSPHGEQELVVVDERNLLAMLIELQRKKYAK